MFGFGKSKKDKSESPESVAEQDNVAVEEPVVDLQSTELAPAAISEAADEANDEQVKGPGLFARLRGGLARTNEVLNTDVRDLIAIKKQIDDEVLEELEIRLLIADVGIEATRAIIDDLTQRVSRKQLNDSDALFAALREDMAEILLPVSAPLQIEKRDGPFVILVVGINGAGKTTTIGKLAKRLKSEGKSVMLAAGDTFRAAAVEQLQVWGERNDIPVVAQGNGADSASVIFDAIGSAKARNIDVLIADTAGRLHTQSNLMEELKKVRRVIGKQDESAPHEVLLVLDAGTGQNALNQAEQFHQAVGVSGIALTKLDGTAKGGILFAIAKKTGIPIRFIGVGEAIEDLRVFNSEEFIQALFDQ